jgi:hypothetical protein
MAGNYLRTTLLRGQLQALLGALLKKSESSLGPVVNSSKLI